MSLKEFLCYGLRASILDVIGFVRLVPLCRRGLRGMAAPRGPGLFLNICKTSSQLVVLDTRVAAFVSHVGPLLAEQVSKSHACSDSMYQVQGSNFVLSGTSGRLRSSCLFAHGHSSLAHRSCNGVL